MKRLVFYVFAILLLWASMASGGMKKGSIVMDFKIHSGKGQHTQLWIPYPLSDDFQRISDVRIKGNYGRFGIYREPVSGAIYLYAEWNNSTDVPELRFHFNAETKERSVKEMKESGNIPVEVRRYMKGNRFVPTDGRIREVAEQIIRGKKRILEKARAVYDWVVENTYRDPNVRGCGRGIVEETLARRSGKCADISSVFVALARAAGVPAREVFGLRLAKEAEKDMTGGYHCWAEFYLPGTGWVPVDPADVRKVMLVKKLSLKEAEPYREYFFGKVDEFRIVLERGGRGVTLDPPASEPLNYFMYPYGEVNGKPLDYLDPKNFSYSIHFKEIK
ncbi:MAG: transglutaminase domain-containing protein [Nitrospirae bacterium]|nr:transglutaminase domain-containing protein [Nitrospirota bacterium]